MKSSRNRASSSLSRRLTRAFLLFLSYILIAAGLYVLPKGNGVGIIVVLVYLPVAALILAMIWTMYYTLGAICAGINSNFRSNKPNLLSWILHPKPLKSALAHFRSRARKSRTKKKTPSSSWNGF